MQHGAAIMNPGATYNQFIYPGGMNPQATHNHAMQAMPFRAISPPPDAEIDMPQYLTQTRDSMYHGAAQFLLSLPKGLEVVLIRDLVWKFIPSSRPDKEKIFFDVMNDYLPMQSQDFEQVQFHCKYQPRHKNLSVNPAVIEKRRREKAGRKREPVVHPVSDVQQLQLDPAATAFVPAPNPSVDPSTVATTPALSEDHGSDSETATTQLPVAIATGLGIEGLAEAVETLDLAQPTTTEDPGVKVAASTSDEQSNISATPATSLASPPYRSPTIICAEKVEVAEVEAKAKAEKEAAEQEERRDKNEHHAFSPSVLSSLRSATGSTTSLVQPSDATNAANATDATDADATNASDAALPSAGYGLPSVWIWATELWGGLMRRNSRHLGQGLSLTRRV
ncbi:MAG: hypothetical protein MMC33_009659 [Icmadophila ericetorum]|nr:hypothetical protein [Icmadophila ericetorum]